MQHGLRTYEGPRPGPGRPAGRGCSLTGPARAPAAQGRGAAAGGGPAAPARPQAHPRRAQVTPAPAAPRAAAELPGSQKVPERPQQELRDGGRRRCCRSAAVAARAGGAEQPWAAARRRRSAEPPPPPKGEGPALPPRPCRAGRFFLGGAGAAAGGPRCDHGQQVQVSAGGERPRRGRRGAVRRGAPSGAPRRADSE